MNRLIHALMFSFALSVAPIAASASSVEEAIIGQLQEQGFRQITISRTFLGRTRIKALRGTLEREIVINPRSGVILRDYSKSGSGEAGIPNLINPVDGRPTSQTGQAPAVANPDDAEDAEEEADDGDDADNSENDGDQGDDGDDADEGDEGDEGDDGEDGDEGDEGDDGDDGEEGDDGDEGDGDEGDEGDDGGDGGEEGDGDGEGGGDD